jgi:hypothetical protein
MTDSIPYVVRFVKRGNRRTAYLRPSDRPDAWVRVQMAKAQKFLRDNIATEEVR